jgi:hypothetical protein
LQQYAFGQSALDWQGIMHAEARPMIELKLMHSSPSRHGPQPPSAMECAHPPPAADNVPTAIHIHVRTCISFHARGVATRDIYIRAHHVIRMTSAWLPHDFRMARAERDMASLLEDLRPLAFATRTLRPLGHRQSHRRVRRA